MTRWVYFPIDTMQGVCLAEGKALQSLQRKEYSWSLRLAMVRLVIRSHKAFLFHCLLFFRLEMLFHGGLY